MSNAEIGVEGEYAYCDECGLLFHWEQLTLTSSGAYFCDDHVHEGIGGVTVTGYNEKEDETELIRCTTFSRTSQPEKGITN